jgi:hypothetical protein
MRGHECHTFRPVIAVQSHPPSGDESGLELALDRRLPEAVRVGPPTALFCAGTCFHRDRRVTELAITVNGVSHRPTAQRMPRLDRFEELHPTLPLDRAAKVDRDPDSPRDSA